ncbi:MAG: hypothetical protein HRT88_18350 [Lentisphaeraceae bacterium]|nr:hypothetical protein [Lentisphaeraceae bacterium]
MIKSSLKTITTAFILLLSTVAFAESKQDSQATKSFDAGSCCAKAEKKGKDCKHGCCKKAAKEKSVCKKCNPANGK